MSSVKSLFSNYINRIILAWVVGGFLLLLIYFTWSLNRGFDLTDESFYVLLAKHPSEIRLFVSAQHWFTAFLWKVTGNLYLFRASGLILLLFTSALFTWGALHAYKVVSVVGNLDVSEKAVVYACSLSSALLYGATINFSPCYNLLDACTAYAAVSLILRVVGSTLSLKVKTCYLLAGFSIGIAMMNKFSAGFSILCLIALIVFMLNNSVRSNFFRIGLICIGMLSISSFFILFHMKSGNVFSDFQFGMSVFKMVQTEPSSARIIRYMSEFSSQMYRSGAFIVIGIVCLNRYVKIPGILRYTNFVVMAVVILSGIYWFKSNETNRWLGVTDVLSALLVLSLLITLETWTKNLKTTVLTISLILMPYCTAVGTGNAINTQIVVSLSSWGLVISMLIISSKSAYKSNAIGAVVCPIFIAIIIVHVLFCSYEPYHLKASIWDQVFATRIGSIGIVKTDKDTHDFIDSLTAVKQKYIRSSGRPYLGFYGEPGIALIFEAVPVYSPWLTLPKQSEYLLKRVDPVILESSIIGIKLLVNGLMPELPGQYSDLSANYKKCGEFIIPYNNQQLQIWLPNK